MEDIMLTRAHPDYAVDAATLRNTVITQDAGTAYTPSQTATWLALDNAAKLRDAFANPLYPAFVLRGPEGLRGFTLVKGNEVSKLFATLRCGYGSHLLNAAEKAIFNQFDEAVVSASLNAVPFYVARGYVPMFVHQNDYRGLLPGNAGVFFPTMWMVKKRL